MDALTAEIERQKQAHLLKIQTSRQGQLKEKQQHDEVQQLKRSFSDTVEVQEASQKSDAASSLVEDKEQDTILIEEEELKQRLREMSQPVTLFGESALDRYQRYLSVVKTYVEPPHKRAKQDEIQQAKRDADKESLFLKYSSQYQTISTARAVNDAQANFKLLYIFYKNVLYRWSLLIRDAEDLRWYTLSVKYMKPLFKQLRNCTLDQQVHEKLADITQHVVNEDYAAANDAYMRLAIGNAQWPIGITAAILHQRKALDRISEEASSGHVLNNEVTRRWVQSVKRLIGVCQRL